MVGLKGRGMVLVGKQRLGIMLPNGYNGFLKF